MSDPSLPPVPQPRKRRGCMFYGCMTVLVLLVVVCALAISTVFYVKNAIANYTATEAVTLPKVDMSDEEFQKLEARVHEFDDAMEHDKATAPLVLNERDLNALIEKSNKADEVAGHVYVALKGDVVSGQVSVPLTKLGWLASGRYFNGEATFKVSMDNGVLNVTTEDAKVKGSPLPERIMNALRGKNLASDANKNPDNAKSLSHVESIKVKDGSVIVIAKAAK